MHWTPQDVERWMITAERSDPRVRNPGEARPAGWAVLYVSDAEQRRALKLWVWCRANGYGFHGYCVRRNLSYTTAMRRKNAAVAAIVAGLNSGSASSALVSQKVAAAN